MNAKRFTGWFWTACKVETGERRTMVKKENANPKKKGVALIVLSALLWGTLPVFSKWSYQLGSNAMTSAAMRSYLAGGMMLVWLAASGRLAKLKWKEWPFYCVYGVIAGGGTFVFYMSAVERLSTAMASMLLYTAPAFVVLFERAVYKIPLTAKKCLAMALTFEGCFLVVKGYDLRALQADFPGILIGLLSGLCYSMTTILGRKAGRYHDSAFNAAMMIVTGTLVFWVVRPPWKIVIPDPTLWICFLAIAVLGTVLGYSIYLKGFELLSDGGLASTISILEPVFGTVLSVLCFQEKLEALQMLGMLIVILGVALLVGGAKAKRIACR